MSEGPGRRFTLPSRPRNVAVARRQVLQFCAAEGWPGPMDTLALLVSEVATNAILHAYGRAIRVSVEVVGGCARVEVSDESRVLPLPRGASESAENGRGLALVEALATGWGLDAHPEGKTIWFVVDA